MRAHSPFLFQHPWPVGCSLAVLHLCSKDPGVSEKDGEGAVVLYVSQRGTKKGAGWKGKVGQDGLTGSCGDRNQAKMLYLPNEMQAPLSYM